MFMTPLRGGMTTWTLEHLGALTRVAPEIEPVAYVKPATARFVRDRYEWAETIELIEIGAGERAARATRIASELVALPIRLRRDGIDVLHSVANLGPLRCPAPHVLTVHDLAYRRYPGLNPGPSRHLLEWLLPRAARGADLIATPSEYSRSEIVDLLEVRPAAVRVIPMGPGVPRPAGVDGSGVRAELGIGGGPLLLSVGAGFEHKNVARLLDAFARVGPDRDACLIHVGPPIFEGEAWRERARELGIADRLRWAGFEGFVSDEQLERYFAAADLLVHPALLEGFGMLPLEAMARELPVACSAAASLPEVAGDAVAYFDPEDVDAMATVLAGLLDDPGECRRLVEAGREWVRRYSWERTARGYAELYAEALAGSAATAPAGD